VTTPHESKPGDQDHQRDGGAGDGPQPIALRASDAERHATITVLQDATARGLLTHEEGGERMAAAWAARLRDDLPTLTADLPPAPVASVVAPGWRQVISLTLLQARASAGDLTTGGWRTRQSWAVLAALLVLVLLGGFGILHEFTGGPAGGLTHRH